MGGQAFEPQRTTSSSASPPPPPLSPPFLPLLCCSGCVFVSALAKVVFFFESNTGRSARWKARMPSEDHPPSVRQLLPSQHTTLKPVSTTYVHKIQGHTKDAKAHAEAGRPSDPQALAEVGRCVVDESRQRSHLDIQSPRGRLGSGASATEEK